jgi:hypothetical protein
MTNRNLNEMFVTLSEYKHEKEFANGISQFIDLAAERGSIEHIERGIDILSDWMPRLKSQKNKTCCHFFLANAWGDKRNLNRVAEREIGGWDWEQTEIENEILNLRLADKYFNPNHHTSDIWYRINTNLANIHDTLGRPIKALYHWNKVIKSKRKFGMALANKGNCLIYHGKYSIANENFRRFYLQVGYRDLKEGSQYQVDSGAKQIYVKRINDFENNYLKVLETPISIPITKTKLDDNYVQWCLTETLFLNSILDIESYPYAIYDNISADLKDEELNNFFIQIKEEFRLARSFFFQANGIKLQSYEFNSGVEYKKIAFRILYSLFDKIGYLINTYYTLGIPNKKVDFHSLWYLEQKKANGLREDFINNKNLFLRGIYWISKDLFHNTNGFKDNLSPDAKDIDTLRHYLEHRSFQIGETSKPKFTYSITESEFDDKILSLLRLTRECIMYFIYSVNWQKKHLNKHEI